MCVVQTINESILERAREKERQIVLVMVCSPTSSVTERDTVYDYFITNAFLPGAKN